MHFLLLIIILLIALALPQWWATRVIGRHSTTRDDIPGTGGELARHLLDIHRLEGVAVESTERGDHYDPEAKVVRLRGEVIHGRSLSAVAIAAHEVSHALQDASGHHLLRWRTTLVKFTANAGKFAMGGLLLSPGVLVMSPPLGRLLIVAAVLSMLLPTLVHLITLPLELHASFSVALPMLDRGGYLGSARDFADVRSILLACSLTYVAASAASLLNVWRWFALLRR